MIDLEDFGTESEGIDFAYIDLTRPAFAVWIRLMTLTTDQHQRGRDYLSKQLGYSEPRASQIFKELCRKGYIKMDAIGPFIPTRLVLIKRLILKGEDHIIKLG